MPPHQQASVIAAAKTNPLTSATFGAGVSIGQPLALTLVVGGTSFRVVMRGTNVENVLAQVAWEDFRKEKGGQPIKDMAPDFVRHIAGLTRRSLDTLRVPVEQIALIDASAAGHVSCDDGIVKINTQNTGVHFSEYRLGYEFSKALIDCADGASRLPDERGWLERIKESGANDAVRGAQGEILDPMGRLYGAKEKSLIFIIVGTGCGAISLVDGRPTSDVIEAGHTLLFNEVEKRFEHWTLDKLQFRHCYDGSKFINCPERYTYLEHLIAGPWLAIGFGKSLGFDNGLKYELVAMLNERLVGRGEAPRVTINDIHALIDLEQSKYAEWGERVNDSIAKLINTEIFEVQLADSLLSRHSKFSSDRNQLLEKLWQYKINKIYELAAALAVLHERYPTLPIVLAGGVAERLSKDPNFMPIMDKIVGKNVVKVSLISGERRESAFGLSVVEKMAPAAATIH